MARKKKTEKKAVVKTEEIKEVKQEKKPELKHSHSNEIIWVDFKDIPGRVLGKVYEINGLRARLVYLGEKCKFIVE